MKKNKILIVLLIALCSLRINAQDIIKVENLELFKSTKIYFNEDVYIGSKGFNFSVPKHGTLLELYFTKDKNGKGLMIAEYFEAITDRYKIRGDFLLYLSNDKTIKCLDRKIYSKYSKERDGAINMNYSYVIYYLTKSEMEMLKTNNIEKISYSFLDSQTGNKKRYFENNLNKSVKSINEVF